MIPPPFPLNEPHLSMHLVFLEALPIPVVPRGGSLLIDPLRCCSDQQSSAPAVACAPPTIVITLIIAFLQKLVPQRIGNVSTAAICASIDASALANSINNDNSNDNDGVEYTLFGNAPIPSRKLGEGQDNYDDDDPPPSGN